MLPRHTRDVLASKALAAYRSPGSLPEYICRVFDYKQMDFEASLDQMKTLLSRNPGRVYKTSIYRKQMKDQYARDDPAFAVLQVGLLMASTFVHGVVLHVQDLSLVDTLSSMFSAVMIDWLLFGLVAATAGWVVANGYLRAGHGGILQQEQVEWQYAFDIHCNAFVPLFGMLHVVQFCLLPVLNSQSLVASILANGLYALAFSAYCYITHLGYRALPFLTKTDVFLYPVGGIVVVFLLLVLLGLVGTKVNATRILVPLHFA